MPYVETTSVHLSGTQYQQVNHLSDFYEIPYRHSYKSCQSCLGFIKISAMKGTLYLRAQMKICQYVLHFLSNLDKIQDKRCPKNLMHDCEFHENLHSASHTLLTSINKFIFVHSGW
jgi:hypothetical protein